MWGFRSITAVSYLTSAVLLCISATYIMFADDIMRYSVKSVDGLSKVQRFQLLRVAAGISRKKGMLAFAEGLLVLMIPRLPPKATVDASAKMALRFMLSGVVSFATWIVHGRIWSQWPLMAEVFVFAPLSLCWVPFVKSALAKDTKAATPTPASKTPSGLLYTIVASSILSIGSGLVMISFPHLVADGLIDAATLIPQYGSRTSKALEEQNLTICRDLTRQLGVSLLIGEGLVLWDYKDALHNHTQHIQVAVICFARALLAGCIALYNQVNGGWHAAAWSDPVLCAVFAVLYLYQAAPLLASSLGLTRSKLHQS